MPDSTLPLIKTSQFLVDLYEIAIYLSGKSPELGHRFLDRAEQTLRLLAKYPLIGEQYPLPGEPLLRAKLVRGFEKYVVYYRSEAERVVLLRVMHGHQDVPDDFTIR